MELKAFTNKAGSFIKKYRFVTLILIIGLILITLPVPSQEKTITTVDSTGEPELSLDEQLVSVLEKIHGAGKVDVLLSIASGEEILYQTNYEETSDADSTKKRSEVITVTDSERNQNGLIRQRIAPSYQGAIIICQGADDPVVRLSIVDAVSKLTGLGANKISVLKMK